MIFDTLLERVRRGPRRRMAVAGAGERAVLAAALRAADERIADPILIGDGREIERLARELGVSPDRLEIDHRASDALTAARTVERIREGDAAVVMKGRVHTATLMREGLRGGLRPPGAILTHVALYGGSRFRRPLAVSDAALIPEPTFEQRLAIVRNAVFAMRRLGIAEPRVALLAASEEVDDKFPASVDAARLAAQNAPGGLLEGCGVVEGPMDLGAAVDAHTADVKGVRGRVAGRADVLIAPDLVSANLLGKAVIYFAEGRVGGCVIGAARPIAMVSRASPPEDKLRSILFAVAVCEPEDRQDAGGAKP